MTEKNQTATEAQPDRKPVSDTPRLVDAGRKAQIDEARDEGAGRTSLPVEQVTSANDE